MYYKQDLDKTVQWNTHDLSGGVPVFGLDTKQSFRPAPMDNVLNQGGYDNVNPNVFRQALGIDQISAIITQDIIPRINRIQVPKVILMFGIILINIFGGNQVQNLLLKEIGQLIQMQFFQEYRKIVLQ